MLEAKDVKNFERLEQLLVEAYDIICALQIDNGLKENKAEPATALGQKAQEAEFAGEGSPRPDTFGPGDKRGKTNPGVIQESTVAGGANNAVGKQANTNQVAGQSEGTSKQGGGTGNTGY